MNTNESSNFKKTDKRELIKDIKRQVTGLADEPDTKMIELLKQFVNESKVSEILKDDIINNLDDSTFLDAIKKVHLKSKQLEDIFRDWYNTRSQTAGKRRRRSNRRRNTRRNNRKRRNTRKH